MGKFINKYFLLFVVFAFLFVVIEFVLKQQVEEYAIYENNAKLENILTNQKALHSYVENMQKPVIYKLKKENKLYDEFFDPNILSFTYIARNIHALENKILEENNSSTKYYKLASNNPRNPFNTANDFEKDLIKKFNNSTLKEYKEVIEENGEKFLYFAKPVGANQESCMKCHSDPKNAPQELLNIYGNEKGFYEKVGEIRAIISIKIPLDKELKNAFKYYNTVSIIIFLSLLIIYIVISYLMRKNDKKQQRLEELVNIDQLTHCYNRRAFISDIQYEIELSKRTKNNFSLITFDIDFFKYINDTYGHQRGDEVLMKISKIVDRMNRNYDKFYRVGGEEFMILCPSTNLENAIQIAERVRRSIEIYKLDDITNVTVSIGVCEYNENDDYESLYKKVDNALYLAKNNGRNRVEACLK